jgi:hypothetical protein
MPMDCLAKLFELHEGIYKLHCLKYLHNIRLKHSKVIQKFLFFFFISGQTGNSKDFYINKLMYSIRVDIF